MMQPRLTCMVVNEPGSLPMILAQGYKVLLCTEDSIDPNILMHPNIVKSSILLPPYEALTRECDCMTQDAIMTYQQYLIQHPNVRSFMQIVYLSVYMNNPICLYLGTEAMDLQLVQQLPNLLAECYGLNFGGQTIELSILPAIFEQMYIGGDLTGIQLLSYWPQNTDFTPAILTRLVGEIPPPVPIANINAVNAYFKDVAAAMNGTVKSAYGQTLYMPFQGGTGGGAT